MARSWLGELTDVPDDQKIQKDYPDTRRTQKDVPDDQKTSEDQERPRRPIRFKPIRDWIPIRHCLLDTLRSQIECDEMSLHGHLFTVFLASHTYHWFVRCYGYYEWDLGYVKLWYDSPCFLEVASTYRRWWSGLLWGERTLSPIFGLGAEGCVLGTSTCDGWRASVAGARLLLVFCNVTNKSASARIPL